MRLAIKISNIVGVIVLLSRLHAFDEAIGQNYCKGA